MVYGGAIASGAFAGQSVVLFGWEFESGFPAYFAIAVAGTVGYTLGSIGAGGSACTVAVRSSSDTDAGCI